MSDDDAIIPDSVDDPPDHPPDHMDSAGNAPRNAGPSGRRSGRSSVDDLAQRVVAVLLGLLRRANALAGAVLIFSVVTCVLGFVLGTAALDGTARIVWVVVGGLAALCSIGSVAIAMWRLHAVRQGSEQLVNEVRSLIDGAETSRRTVIETVDLTENSDHEGVVQVSRRFFSLRELVRNHVSDFRQLSLALASITSLPGLLALSTVIGFAFVGLSFIFTLSLIF